MKERDSQKTNTYIKILVITSSDFNFFETYTFFLNIQVVSKRSVQNARRGCIRNAYKNCITEHCKSFLNKTTITLEVFCFQKFSAITVGVKDLFS